MFKVQFDSEKKVWWFDDAGVRVEFESCEQAEEFAEWRASCA